MAQTRYDLKDRVAIVTGGSRGIGAGIAERLATCGARVALTFVTNASAAEAVQDRLARQGYRVQIYRCDVCQREEIRRTWAAIADDMGGLDILVNNAGINRRKDFEDTTDDDWDIVMETNLKGAFRCSQEALPYLKKSRYGRIINISSISAQLAGPRTLHYAVSKSGLDTMTRFLGRYCAPWNMTVNSVNPNVVITDMVRDLETSPEGQAFLQETPLGRFATVEDVAQAVAFLASDDAAYLTGHLLHLNGGRYLG